MPSLAASTSSSRRVYTSRTLPDTAIPRTEFPFWSFKRVWTDTESEYVAERHSSLAIEPRIVKNGKEYINPKYRIIELYSASRINSIPGGTVERRRPTSGEWNTYTPRTSSPLKNVIIRPKTKLRDLPNHLLVNIMKLLDVDDLKSFVEARKHHEALYEDQCGPILTSAMKMSFQDESFPQWFPFEYADFSKYHKSSMWYLPSREEQVKGRINGHMVLQPKHDYVEDLLLDRRIPNRPRYLLNHVIYLKNLETAIFELEERVLQELEKMDYNDREVKMLVYRVILYFTQNVIFDLYRHWEVYTGIDDQDVPGEYHDDDGILLPLPKMACIYRGKYYEKQGFHLASLSSDENDLLHETELSNYWRRAKIVVREVLCRCVFDSDGRKQPIDTEEDQFLGEAAENAFVQMFSPVYLTKVINLTPPKTKYHRKAPSVDWTCYLYDYQEVLISFQEAKNDVLDQLERLSE
ncbi:hypothetical protein H072_6037 [Dactylellina haptotyla CBS 200.50]|uniref:F-box domain-containing protein n=1 Tax=Dactylellina haptotyla (strain CBS 200.50) TaxID=1284197 RepID=S8AB65_DACHA|nr:hypothetical protein H072_6037 [Dactylellina haptotyla CBS 200.50]